MAQCYVGDGVYFKQDLATDFMLGDFMPKNTNSVGGKVPPHD